MSKKTLLNESEVRRFMGLAGLPATREIKALREFSLNEQPEDEGMPPAEGAPEDPMAMDDPEAVEDEPELEGEGEGEGVEISDEQAEVLAQLGQELLDAGYVPEEEMPEEPDAGLEEPGLDMGGEEGPPAGGPPGARDYMQETLSGIELIDDNALVETVMARVSTRLVREVEKQKRDKVIDRLANKILNRIN